MHHFRALPSLLQFIVDLRNIQYRTYIAKCTFCFQYALIDPGIPPSESCSAAVKYARFILISHGDVTENLEETPNDKVLETMSGRFAFPSAYGPQMHREELVTLSRTISQQSTTNKLNGTTLSPSAMSAHPAPRHGHSHQRKNFVFTDPVAFRHVKSA